MRGRLLLTLCVLVYVFGLDEVLASGDASSPSAGSSSSSSASSSASRHHSKKRHKKSSRSSSSTPSASTGADSSDIDVDELFPFDDESSSSSSSSASGMSKKSKKKTSGRVAPSNRPKLLSAVSLFRHGERTPITTLPNDRTSEWTEGKGMGELTEDGMRMARNLGRKLRERYIENEALLPDVWRPEDVLVFTSDIDRCHQTVQSALLGLYEDDPQLVPVHSMPGANDLLLRAHGRSKCPSYDKLIEQRFASRDFLAPLAESLQSLGFTPKRFFSKFMLSSGLSEKHVDARTLTRNFDTYGDPFIVLGKQGRLDRSGFAGIDDPFLHAVDKVFEWNRQTRYAGIDVGRLVGAPLLTDIMRRLTGAADAHAGREKRHKLVLYSAHDSTLQSLFAALDPIDGDMTSTTPPYTAHIDAEVLYDSSTNKTIGALSHEDYFVRFMYNFEPFVIRGCSSTLCRLSRVIRIFKANGVLVSAEKWEERCGLEISSTKFIGGAHPRLVSMIRAAESGGNHVRKTSDDGEFEGDDASSGGEMDFLAFLDSVAQAHSGSSSSQTFALPLRNPNRKEHISTRLFIFLGCALAFVLSAQGVLRLAGRCRILRTCLLKVCGPTLMEKLGYKTIRRRMNSSERRKVPVRRPKLHSTPGEYNFLREAAAAGNSGSERV